MKLYKLLWLVDSRYTTMDGVTLIDTDAHWQEFFGEFMSPYYNWNEFELVEVASEVDGFRCPTVRAD